jgi:beta-lactamase class D
VIRCCLHMPNLRVKATALSFIMLIVVISLVSCARKKPSALIPMSSIQSAFLHQQGCLVIINCTSAEIFRFNPKLASTKLPPCSTFKIWNTLIGCETGEVSSAEAPFYTWDGVTRSLPEWNRDQTLSQAFQASCVPAFQALARRIGAQRMRQWVGKLKYGDCDTSAGVDVFWLPARDRKTLLITPDEQTQMIYKLLTEKLPCSEKSRILLKDLMLFKKTELGALYGKTGTGSDESGQHNICWFVGFYETGGEQYAFACVLIGGTDQSGRDTRALIQNLLETNHLL